LWIYLFDIIVFISIERLTEITDIAGLKKVKAHDFPPINSKIDAAFLP